MLAHDTMISSTLSRTFYRHFHMISRQLSRCTIDVSDHDALVDDVIKICVNGLQKQQEVTVCAKLVEDNDTFCSHGCFVADDDGIVDISKQPSVSGTYQGVSPMGLFWSMKPGPGQQQGLRLIKRNASMPLGVDLTVLNGHLGYDDACKQAGTKLCDQHIRRWYMARDVQKVPVRTGRVRGSLFLPPGEGPFPGVVDMFGITGSLMEFRSALFASRGFAALALPYFKHDDLPKSMDDVELEYFMEAVDWFTGHPQVSDNIGVLGTSKGGFIAHYLGCYNPKVKTVVSINGLANYTGEDPRLYENGRLAFSRNVKSAISDDIVIENAVKTPDGVSLLHCWPDNMGTLLPVWETNKKVLLIVGDDDSCLNPKYMKTLYEHFPEDKKDNCELVVYPKAGHLIEPPYAPLTRTTIIVIAEFPGGKFPILWGGETEAHAFAQEDSWKRILQHFRMNLSTDGNSAQHSIHRSSL